MYDSATRAQALRLLAHGRSKRSVAAEFEINRATLHAWARDPAGAVSRPLDARCWVCAGDSCRSPGAYAYLLGQYLGDGYLVTSARIPKLRIACADTYPGIAAAVDAAMATTCGNATGYVRAAGCSDRYSYWKHWPCVLPQHGPGMKHTRPIVLAEWQRAIVDAEPWAFARGLIHSDGCRSLNRVTVRGTTYEYPRYTFANESRDILAIFGETLDRVGVAWRYNRPNSISVARRDAVALLDHHVGPKT